MLTAALLSAWLLLADPGVGAGRGVIPGPATAVPSRLAAADLRIVQPPQVWDSPAMDADEGEEESRSVLPSADSVGVTRLAPPPPLVVDLADAPGPRSVARPVLRC